MLRSALTKIEQNHEINNRLRSTGSSRRSTEHPLRTYPKTLRVFKSVLSFDEDDAVDEGNGNGDDESNIDAFFSLWLQLEYSACTVTKNDKCRDHFV